MNSEIALSEGTKIGGCYVLRQNISKAGESPVWLASDEVLGKDVTLHFVPAAVVADERAMTELRQEVKRNRQLIHPNILRVYDFVEDGNRVAISMDAFEGESLQEVLKKKGRLDPDDMKPWAAQLAETLSDAHRIQLFHRDLSPANLYLRPNGGLLVANFGLSRVILNSLERAGIAKGEAARLEYLSPQQLDGERPGASDDIYGLGVLMHELLTGAPTFAGEDIVPQIRKNVPAPASVLRAAAGATAPVPASWEKLIAGCLAKTPEARPRNLSEVLALIGQDSGPARTPIQPAAPVVTPAELDAPLKTPEKVESVANGAVEKTPAPVVPSPEPPVEKSSVSKKPLHPEIPPVPTSPVAKKSPVKGALSANFPDLDRPRSKAPLVWLLLAAGIIGVGIYMRNTPDANEGDANGSVARLDGHGNSQVAVPSPGSEKSTAPEAKSPEVLPDPVPITPVKIASSVQANIPGETAVLPPKSTGASESNTLKTGGLIGTESTSTAQQPAANVVPDSLVSVSAGAGEKPEPDTKAGTTAKTATPVKVAANASETGNAPGKNPATTVKPATPQPENNAAQPPQPPPITAKSEPLPVLPELPQPLAKLALEKATTAQLDEAKKEREAAIENLRKTNAAADAAHQEATRRLAAAKLEKDKRQKELDAKRKTLGPVIQQAEALEKERKKLEDDAAKSQAAAAEAAKQAEAAKKKLDDAVVKGAETLTARQQAEADLNLASSELANLGKEEDSLSQLLTKADTLRQQTRLSQQQAEQDLQKITSASDQARRAEMEAQRKASQEKIAAIEKQLQDLQAQALRFDPLLDQMKEFDAGPEAIKRVQEKKSATQKQISDLQAEVKKLSGDDGKVPVKETGTVKPPVTPPDTAKTDVKTDKTPVPESAPAANSLGMKFVPVGDVQFSVYLTTRKDFEAFATATGLKSEAWRNPGFKQDTDHPVVNVTWREAEAFCKWLTEKERKAGLLKSGEAYRLPTDVEWSKAVGLPAESGATPEERDMGVQDVYPWGNQWPPPAGAGNYAGEETQTEIPIPNYNDGFPNTSPVGKFRANALGLHDMGGNVWQWVGDFWNSENRAKTLRGGSWYNGAIPLSLLSSCRISSSPDTLHDTYGFRIVKGAETAKARHK
jgi:serine/threonine protein kinase/formylglycine-generating enzyme required for sulfatase activity